MKKPLPWPRSEGLPPRQAHADLPAGSYEREFGSEGFFGPATHIVHAHPPTSWTGWEGPLRPRAYDLSALDAVAASPWGARPLLSNRHVKLRWWRLSASMDHLVRNADGAELAFVHAGAGDLFCDFGHLAYREGDYLVLPRGTQWRLEVREPSAFLLVEASDAGYGLPERGIVGQHAFFDPALLETPTLDDAFRAQQGEAPTRVVIKAADQVTTIRYPFNPLDAIGWQGDLLPARIHWRQLRPLTSPRYHLPPSAHTTFVSERFVVCTFCPRPIETDPGALKLPFFHSNNDYDEVIFYHRGDFTSRDDIGAGMLTLHPRGVPHGPHPKALAAALRGARTETDEVAVMIDTRDPLAASDEVAAVERTDYWRSWNPDERE